MNWYKGSIAEAVAEAKLHNRIFLVYIEGTDDLSIQMTAAYNDPVVITKLTSQNCVALKLSANSHSHQQFSEIYPVLVTPSSFFIGQNGIPLEILTGSLEAKDFCGKLDKVFELHTGGTKNVVEKKSASGTGTTASMSEASAAADPTAPIAKSKSESSSNSSNESSITSEDGIAGSSTDVPLEDRVQRAKELLEERRILKELEENEKTKREEIERRKVGKALQQAQQTKQETELKEWAINRAKEKEEERVAKERVRAQIAQDRAERAAKFQQTKAKEAEVLKEKEHAVLRAEQEKGAKEAALRSTIAHLQFRLPNGSSVTHQFPADSTLEDARRYVSEEVRPACGSFTLCTAFPRRHFTENNYAETLRDLQLAPSATILILPAAASVSRGGGIINQWLWVFLSPLLSVWRTVSSWFSGAPVASHTSSPQPSSSQAGTSTDPRSTSPNRANQNKKTEQKPASQQKDQKGFYRQDGNIFRLSSQQNKDDDDDENNTWNGNSTQQM